MCTSSVHSDLFSNGHNTAFRRKQVMNDKGVGASIRVKGNWFHSKLKSEDIIQKKVLKKEHLLPISKFRRESSDLNIPPASTLPQLELTGKQGHQLDA